MVSAAPGIEKQSPKRLPADMVNAASQQHHARVKVERPPSRSITVPITAADDAGNSATEQVTISISKSDTQDPTITSFTASPSTIQLKTSDQTETVTFTAVASDNVGINTAKRVTNVVNTVFTEGKPAVSIIKR